MAIEKTIYINVEGQEAIEEVDKINDSLEETTDITDEISSQALAAAGSFKVMGVSVNQVIGTLKKLKITLISTGIGAIAVAVGTLAAGFFSTQRGADALNSVLTPLTNVLDTMWGIIQNIATIFVDITQGTAAWEDLGTAISGVGDELNEAWRAGVRLHELNILIEEDDLNLIAAGAKLRRQSEEARLIADDTTKSYKERVEAAKLAIESEEALATITIAALNRQIEAKKIQFATDDTNRVVLKELITLEAQRDLALAASATRQKEAQNKINSLNAQYAEKDVKDKVDPLTGLSINDLATIETETGVHLDNMNALYQGYADQQNRISTETANANIESAEAEKEVRVSALEATGQALVQMSIIAGKESKAGKALAVSAILVSAAVASIKLWEAYAPGGPWALPAAIAHQALIAASTVAALAQVNSSGSGSSATANSSAGSVPAPSYNVVGATQTSSLEQQLLSEGITVNQDTPIKSYVVASDVTTQAALDRQIEANAGF